MGVNGRARLGFQHPSPKAYSVVAVEEVRLEWSVPVGGVLTEVKQLSPETLQDLEFS